MKKMISMILCMCIMMCTFAGVASAATSMTASIKGYAYSDAHFTVYKDTKTSAGTVGTCFGNEDLITIHDFYSNGWAKITYPAGSRTKTGYCQSKYLVINTDFSKTQARASSKISAYPKPNCSGSFGSVYAGDLCYIIGNNGTNTQLIYPVSGGYKIGWVKGVYTNNGGKLALKGSNTINISSGTLASPVPSGCKFSRKTNDKGTNGVTFYCYHDINRNVSTSTPVYAIADGVVTYKQAFGSNGQLRSYGNFIDFKSHQDGYRAIYAHLSSFKNVSMRSTGTKTVTVATREVKKGEILGYIGTTGNSSGVHLHFELYKNGKRIDPTSVIKGLT